MQASAHYIMITQGNIDNNHFYLTDTLDIFPADVFDGGDESQAAPRSVRIEWGIETVDTDIDRTKNNFRKRSWVTRFFSAQRIQAGDQVLLEQIEPYLYRVSKA